MTKNFSAISSIDGRYHEKTKPLAEFFSEHALMKYRIVVEGEYLIALSLSRKTALRKFTTAEINKIRACYGLTEKDFERIKEIEGRTNHDVKAVEYYLKGKLSKTSLRDSLEWIHFALTSEDVNNISYALILSDALERTIIPSLQKVVLELNRLSKKYKNLPMLSRTHGQSASPTTFGKEMRVYAFRLEKKLAALDKIKIEAKLNGATGNYNAHYAAYPKVDWVRFSKSFIEGFNKRRVNKLSPNLVTTQIECHDSYVEIFDNIKNMNTILIDFNQDMWRYISDGWVGQKPKAGEVGSSTMPHKINPIDFENSEGNLGIANSLFEFFGRKLPISRLQRDLSDSTVERSFGLAFAHSYLSYLSLLRGLGKVQVNETLIKEALNAHPEVIAEAIQTILRREGMEMPYEKLKDLTRGRAVTLEDIHVFIKSLELSGKLKKELLRITPENYTGFAQKLVG